MNADVRIVVAGNLETSYRVMRAYHLLKVQPLETRKLREFVGKCRNSDGGYGLSPGQKSSVGATYFASIILHGWTKSECDRLHGQA